MNRGLARHRHTWHASSTCPPCHVLARGRRFPRFPECDTLRGASGWTQCADGGQTRSRVESVTRGPLRTRKCKTPTPSLAAAAPSPKTVSGWHDPGGLTHNLRIWNPTRHHYATEPRIRLDPFGCSQGGRAAALAEAHKPLTPRNQAQEPPTLFAVSVRLGEASQPLSAGPENTATLYSWSPHQLQAWARHKRTARGEGIRALTRLMFCAAITSSVADVAPSQSPVLLSATSPTHPATKPHPQPLPTHLHCEEAVAFRHLCLPSPAVLPPPPPPPPRPPSPASAPRPPLTGLHVTRTFSRPPPLTPPLTRRPTSLPP